MATRLIKTVSATSIPAGEVTELAAGTSLHIVQTLGGNVTVRTDGGLYRIAKQDAAAIAGLDLSTLESDEKSGAEQPFSEELVWEALKSCYDPEIPVNIVDLGLIYDLNIEDADSSGKRVEVKMTLTAQGCGMGPVIAEDARQKIQSLPSVTEAKVYIVWDPVWTPQMISKEGRQKLGLE